MKDGNLDNNLNRLRLMKYTMMYMLVISDYYE